MTSLDSAYKQALSELVERGTVVSPRTMPTLELLAYSLTIDPKQNLVTIPGFETDKSYAELELEWYRAATNRIDYHPRIERTWKRFSDDGETVNSAYGHRVFPTQWNWVKEKLQSDPDSRQALININRASDKDKPTKDFPCTIAFQTFIRANKLHWVTMMRSQDLFYGTRNDVYCFTELQKQLAGELGVEPGNYTHFMGSMHLYEKHWDIAKKVVGR